jgi:hypothetical protein
MTDLNAALAWVDQLNDHMDCSCYDTLVILAAAVRKRQDNNAWWREQRDIWQTLLAEADAKTAKAEAALAELRGRVCNSCKWQWDNEHGPNRCGKVSVCGPFGRVVSCSALGNTCGAWAARWRGRGSDD